MVRGAKRAAVGCCVLCTLLGFIIRNSLNDLVTPEPVLSHIWLRSIHRIKLTEGQLLPREPASHHIHGRTTVRPSPRTPTVRQTQCKPYAGRHELSSYLHFLSIRQTIIGVGGKAMATRSRRKKRTTSSGPFQLLPLLNLTYPNGYVFVTNDSGLVGVAMVPAQELVETDAAWERATLDAARASCGRGAPSGSGDVYVCDALAAARTHPHTFSVRDVSEQRGGEACEWPAWTIQERQAGLLTRGGSHFRVVVHLVTSGFYMLCHTKDHFNGTYTVHCPCFVGGCFSVQIVHLSHSFLAFAVYSTSGRNAAPKSSTVVWQAQQCRHHLSAGCGHSDYIGWRLQKQNGGWTWLEHGRPASMMLFSAAERACLADKVRGRVYLVGASHLQFIYEYLEHFHSHNTTIQTRRGRQVQQKFVFFNSLYIEQVSYHLSLLQLTADDVVVFQSGAWDTMFKTLDTFVAGTARLAATLRQIASSTPGVKLLWVKTVPQPEKFHVRPSQPAMHAAMAQLAESLTQFGLANITTVDALGIVEPRNNESIRKAHYFGPLGKTRHFAGSAGYVYANEIVAKMCAMVGG